MYTPDWNAEREKLKAMFSNGTINQSTRPELIHWIMVLANSTPLLGQQAQHDKDNANFMPFLSELLQQRSVTKAEKLAKSALVVAILAAVFTGLQALYAYETYRTTTLPSESGKAGTLLESISTTNKP